MPHRIVIYLIGAIGYGLMMHAIDGKVDYIDAIIFGCALAWLSEAD